MRRLLIVLFGVLGFLASCVHDASARSPRIRDTGPPITLAGKESRVGVLYGDGFIGRDPARPVVLDDKGQVVAVGPLTNDAYIQCDRADFCSVLLSAYILSKAVPKPEGFREGKSLDFYPEHEKQEYGFEHVGPGPMDILTFWTISVRRAPEESLFAGLLVAGLGALCGACWAANQWKARLTVEPRSLWRGSLALIMTMAIVCVLGCLYLLLFLLVFASWFSILPIAVVFIFAWAITARAMTWRAAISTTAPAA